jgi:hypothetical protein
MTGYIHVFSTLWSTITAMCNMYHNRNYSAVSVINRNYSAISANRNNIFGDDSERRRWPSGVRITWTDVRKCLSNFDTVLFSDMLFIQNKTKFKFISNVYINVARGYFRIWLRLCNTIRLYYSNTIAFHSVTTVQFWIDNLKVYHNTSHPGITHWNNMYHTLTRYITH